MKEKNNKTDLAIRILIIFIVVLIVISIASFLAFSVVLSNKKRTNKQFFDNSKISSVNSNEIEKSPNITSDTISVVQSESETVSTNESKVNNTQDETNTDNLKIKKIFPFKCEFNIPEFKKDIFYDSKTNNTLPFRLVIPKNYDSNKKYPVILFLHGAGELGTDNEKHISTIKTMYYYNGDLVSDAFLICPQTNEWWRLDRYNEGDRKGMLSSALNLLEDLRNNYSFDTNRIYVTGLSMGGYATWSLLEEYGNIFAAGMPICGGGNSSNGYKLKDLPIRIYHSLDDPTVNFSASQSMHSAILNAGGSKAEFVILDGLGHNVWDYAFSDREAFCWLFAQNKLTNPTCEYEYIPYLKIVDSQGKIVISDEDIELINHFGSYRDDNYIYAVNICLNFDGAQKLIKSYNSNKQKDYTVYWLNEKLFIYTADKISENNVLYFENVFSEENVELFYKTVSQSIEVLTLK